MVLTVAAGIDVKNDFLRFFIFWSRFLRFLTFFYFSNVFLFLKNVGKVQSICRNSKFNVFINNRILYPAIRM